MKHSLILVFCCLSTLLSFSQLSLKKLDGTVINDGDVFVFDSAVEPACYLGIKTYNTSDSDINVRVKCLGITNATGADVQLCFGNVCVNNITVGSSYPNLPAVIEANSANGDYDHFLNLNTGTDPNAIVEYSFKFYQVNDLGIEIGNSVSFSYRFNPLLTVREFNSLQNLGITLQSNVITTDLEMVTDKNVQYDLYDVTGKLMVHQNPFIGNTTLNVSNLNSGVYILSFKNNQGQKASARIIKK